MNVLLLALSVASGIMAMLTWHSNLPKVIIMRGRLHGSCELLLGFALAFLSPALLADALANKDVPWQFLAADAAMIAYSVCRFRWLRSQCSGSWKRSV